MFKSFNAEIRAISKDQTEAVVAYTGIAKGMGDSIGNALRRTLLTSIPGYAPQAYWVRNMKKFSPMAGVIESTIELDKRISNLRLRLGAAENTVLPREFYLGFKGPVTKKLLARDLVVFYDHIGAEHKNLKYGEDWDVSILNPDEVLLTCGTEQKVNVHILIKCGSGLYFSSSQERVKIEYNDVDLGELVNGFVTVNSNYNPVTFVQYYVEESDSRFTETLVMDVKTTGAVSPATALTTACQVLANYFQSIPSVSAYLPQEPNPEDAVALAGTLSSTSDWENQGYTMTAEVEPTNVAEMTQPQSNPIESLKLDSQYYNLMKTSRIDTVEALKYKVEDNSIDEILNKYNSLYTGNNKVQLSRTYIVTKLNELGIKC